MRELSLATAREYFNYCPKTGRLTWKKRPSQRARVGLEAGGPDPSGYRQVRLHGQRYYAHRIVWLVFHGVAPWGQIDHINGDRSDNRICNLRVVSHSDNARNQKKRKDNTSGHVGVTWQQRSNKWKAQIHIHGKGYHLGCYDELDDAVVARKNAERKYGFHENHGRRK